MVSLEEDIVASLREHCVDKKLTTGTPSEKADIIRSILVHQYHARAAGLLSDVGLCQIQRKYQEMYRKVVDNFDQDKGLNNFAEGALAICNLQRNESQSWKSSLTADKFFSSKTGQKFKRLCQLSAEAENNLEPDHVIKLRSDIHISNSTESFNSNPNGKNVKETTTISNDNSHPSKQINNNSNFQEGAFSFPVTERGNFQIPNNGRGYDQPGMEIDSTDNKMAGNITPFQPVSRGNSTFKLDQAKASFNNQSGRQSNFAFKARDTSGRNQLPYNLPQGWDDPSVAPDLAPSRPSHPFQGGRKHGAYGDQEVPKKPLFSSTGNSGGHSNQPFNKREPNQSNFYRKPEVFREEPDHFNNNMEDEPETYMGPFKTAKEQLSINQQKKYGQNRGPVKPAAYGNVKKSLGTRRGPSSKFVPPVVSKEEEGDSNLLLRKAGPNKTAPPGGEEPTDERLKGLEPKMIELIMNEIMDHGAPIAWDDIAGLEFAKKTIKEIVVWPMLRPDIFTGLRGPPKGLLLFGPPGTGKTLIGKCIASQSKSTFFSISASSLTSKWVGEGEKMVKALFSVSRCHQPAVIFIDEIDSLLSQRTDGEHEASRRIKTEFLVQLDGATTESDERLLVIGATNRPQEIDEAARRRFVKRLYIPLPEKLARKQIIVNLLATQSYQLTEEQLDIICDKTDGYSGSDMANLCREAALGPIRSIDFNQIEMITADQVRPITFEDFDAAVNQVRASVSEKDLDLYIDWNKLYGCGGK